MEKLLSLQDEKERNRIREILLNTFLKDGVLSPTKEHCISLCDDELDIWIYPTEFFTKLELSILKRITEEGSDRLWQSLTEEKLERAFKIARTIKNLKEAA